MASYDEKELQALLSLLDDSDRTVYEHISERLVTLGRDVIPVLEDFWSQSLDPGIQQRIEHIVHRIQFDALKSGLQRWSRDPDNDLLAGLILIARFQYPDLDERKITGVLERLKESAVIETQMHQSPAEKVYSLNRVLFDIFGFRGNTANFHSPQNSFINIALETRKGTPLMLCAIYSILARHAGMPVYGVNLPEHFILAYLEPNKVPYYECTYPRAGVLFYINAFSRGTILYRKDIDLFLKKLYLDPHNAYYAPCTHAEVISRSLRNLALSFRKLGDLEKVAEIEELLSVITS